MIIINTSILNSIYLYTHTRCNNIRTLDKKCKKYQKWFKYNLIHNIMLQRCQVPKSAPQRVEEIINQCQNEIKVAILTGKI